MLTGAGALPRGAKPLASGRRVSLDENAKPHPQRCDETDRVAPGRHHHPRPAGGVRFLAVGITLELVLVYNMPDRAKMHAEQDIYEALDQNNLVHRIAERYPLAETSKAHEAIERGGLDGCVVVDIS